MVSPSPVPPAAPLSNGRNTPSRRSGGMPGPVIVDSDLHVARPGAAAASATCRAWRRALSTRLVTARRTASGAQLQDQVRRRVQRHLRPGAPGAGRDIVQQLRPDRPGAPARCPRRGRRRGSRRSSAPSPRRRRSCRRRPGAVPRRAGSIASASRSRVSGVRRSCETPASISVRCCRKRRMRSCMRLKAAPACAHLGRALGPDRPGCRGPCRTPRRRRPGGGWRAPGCA